MDARCRLILLQFICLVLPHVTVDSFVLRRRSVIDDEQPLSHSFYAGLERPGIGYLDDQYDFLPRDYEMDVPDDYNDIEVANKLMDIIKQEREQEETGPNYGDFGDRDYVSNDDETWTEPVIQNDISDNDDIGSTAAKVPLDKAQLEQIFTDTSEQPLEQNLDKKTTELTKNEVKRLFDETATDGEAEDDDVSQDSTELNNDAPEIDLEVPIETPSDVDKIVNSIKEVKTDDAAGDKVIDVKEETISPEDGTKLTKEWMVELVQDEGDQAAPSGGSGSRKSKRSMDVQSEREFEVAAKQRAVDLLKTYIELQDEENRHLTEALNLATLAQTQRTDRYIDDEVKQLRQAVSDEAAIESLRDMIRSDEDVDTSVEVPEVDEEDNEDKEVEDYYDDVDFLPTKREDIETPEEEDLEYDEENTRNYNKNIFLRERLRQYLLNKELESLQDQIEDVDDQWQKSKMSPPFADVYPESRLNPFTRELEDVEKRYNIDDIDEGDENTAYMRDPDWLKNLETAAAIAKLRDAVQISTEEDDTDVCPAVYELTDDCFVATDRRLTLDDEATQLCNRHQLCYTCGAEFGLAAESCDEGYLREADRLCSQQSVGGRSVEHCRGEAAGLFVIMSEEHRYAPPGATPGICRERCAYDYIVDGR